MDEKEQMGKQPSQEEQAFEPAKVEQTPLPPSHNKLIIGVVAVVVLVVSGTVGAFFFVTQKSDTGPVACTAEAKICPDGSSVGRTGPNCEFAECPVVVAMEEGVPDDWQTYRNEEFGNERYELGWGTVFSYQRYSD